MYYLFTFSLSIFSVSFFPVLPSVWALIPALIGSLILWLCQYRWLALVIAGVVVGCCLGAFKVGQQLPISLEQQVVTVIGRVIDIPQVTPTKQRFDFYTSDSLNTVALRHKRLQLSRYQYSPSQLLVPGQCWKLLVSLRRPRGFLNPAGFDYHAYLLRKGIYGVGYVNSSPSPELLNHDDPRCQSFPPSYDITQGIDRIRWKIFQQIESQVLETTVKGPLLALLLGESQWITGEQWKLLRDTGTIHLLAISGLHIGLAALIGFYLGSFIMKVVYMVRPSMTCQRLLPPLVSISVATSYALLAGLSLPTQRALVMVVLFYTGTVMCRRLPVGYLLGSALLWIALSDPLAMTSAGFWLSFLAVSVLLYGYQGRKVSVLPFWLRYWQELLQTQWLLLIGLALVSLIWLQGISVSSPLANIFAVTLVSLCIVPLLFVLLACWLLALPGAYLIIWFLERLVALLWWGLGIIDQKAPAFWFLPVSEPPWYSILLCSIGVIWLLAPKGIPYRYLGVIGFFPVLFSTRPLIPLSLTFLDVGQGTAVVVQTAQHTLVYDTGPSYSSRFNAGQHILAPYLRSIGARKVNTLVVSHSDYDHAGGLLGLLESSHVDTLLSGQPNVIQKRLGNSAIIAPEVDACQAGQSWQWDHVTFTILWPSTRADFPSLNNNNSSCVLLIEYKDHKILLAGDIERRIESWLLQHYRQQLEAVEIVLVPHHGSGTSSSQAWVNTLLPQWSVISAGYRNRYRHPNDQVVARYQRANSMILNTATVGAVRFTLLTEAKKWQLEKWREDYRRYWH